MRQPELVITVDASASLTYLNNRPYDPTTGVFISIDPLVTKTMQPHIYGAANPVRFSDPSGLEPRPIHNPNYDPDTAGPDPYASGCGGYGCAGAPGSSLTTQQRGSIGASPTRLADGLSQCYWLGASGCDGLRGSRGWDNDFTDLVQGILLGFSSRFGFSPGGGGDVLVSDYYGNNNQSVNFLVEVGPGGVVLVSVVHAPSVTWKDMAAAGLTFTGVALSAVEIGGAASGFVTGGLGCGVAGAAAGANLGVSALSTALSCSGGGSSQCAWSAGATTLSAVTLGGSAAIRNSLQAADLLGGGGAALYNYGNVYGSLASNGFSLAGIGLAYVEYHDSDLGVHSFSVAL